jgi:hypothetical protein
MRTAKLTLSVALFLAVVIGVFRFTGSGKVALAAARGIHEESDASGNHDPFGGVMDQGGKGSGFFKTEKVGTRWMLESPVGHPFWMRAVYAVDWNDGGQAAQKALQEKYRNDPTSFAVHAVERLRDWGFNTLGEYASPYVYPLPTFLRPQGNPQRMPFIRFLDISWYGAIDRGRLAAEPFKTLLAGAVAPDVYHDWPGHVPDVFDPNFAVYARNMAADMRTRSRDTVFTEKASSGGLPDASLKDSPWVIGTTGDDSDYLFGFGPGPDAPSRDGVMHPNIGWIVAVTKPTQHDNPQVGSAFGAKQDVQYNDPVVYAKKAWKEYLQQKYGTIARLNGAWGSNYTTFDSDGGWPYGKGLMDESGHHAWIGDDAVRLSTTRPSVAEDMNAFLEIYADRYFQIVHDAIVAAVPNHLVFSPAVMDSHGGLSRPQILRAAAKYCDVIQVDLNMDRLELLEKTYAETGKPMVAWVGFKANADSAISGSTSNDLSAKTQEERGVMYRREVLRLFYYATHDGTHPILGIDWWEYMDKPSESANWGLVTPNDNAYDGKEDVAARGKDMWGYMTGGENRNYGDFLSAVKNTNAVIDQQLTNPNASKAEANNQNSGDTSNLSAGTQ